MFKKRGFVGNLTHANNFFRLDISFIAGSFCFLCFIVSGKVAYDHYDTAYNMGKNSAQSINKASKKTKQELIKKLINNNI
jgi:hypothetical protein